MIPANLPIRLAALTVCETCPMNSSFCGASKLTGAGSPNAKVLILTDSPSKSEAMNGRLLSGDTGKVIKQIMTAVGLTAENTYVSPIMSCDPQLLTPEASEMAHAACLRRLKVEVGHLPHLKVILCLGAAAASVALGRKCNLDKDMYHFQYSAEYKAHVLVTFHPYMLFTDPDIFPDFTWAFEQASRAAVSDIEKLQAPLPETHVHRGEEAILACLARYASEPVITCDIEADGFNPLTKSMLSIGIGVPGSNRADIIPCAPMQVINPDPAFDAPLPESCRLALKNLMEDTSKRWLFHNGKFDCKFFRRQLGIKATTGHDTMLSHLALDERGGGKDESDDSADKRGHGSHGLKRLAAKYLLAPDWEGDIKKYVPKREDPYSLIPRPVLYNYQGFDITYTGHLHVLFQKLLREEPRSESYSKNPEDVYNDILIPASNEYMEAELVGTLIDIDYVRELDRQMSVKLTSYEQTAILLACKILGKDPKPPPRLTKTGRLSTSKKPLPPVFNIRSPKQVASVLYDHIGVAPTFTSARKSSRCTDKSVLIANKDKHPFIATLLDYRLLQRLYTTYVAGFESRLDIDGRVRATFLLHGTKTGRLSCVDPNLMNIPRNSPIKGMFITDDEHFFLQSDYKQLEVRVAAHLSGDEKLVEACKGDIHWEVCKQVFHKQLKETKEARTAPDLISLMKQYTILSSVHAHISSDSANYLRLLSAATPEDVEGLRKMIVKSLRHNTKYITFGILYGREAESLAMGELKCSVPEAQKYINNFFERFPKVKAFIKKCEHNSLHRGWLETPTGRRRRFPFVCRTNKVRILKMSANMPIQSYANDICMKAFIRIGPMLRERGWGDALFTVHDAINFQIKKEHRIEAIKLIQEVMQTTTTSPHVAYLVDMDEGPSWANAKEIDLETIAA